MIQATESSLSAVEPFKEVNWHIWDATNKVAVIVMTPFSLISSCYRWLSGYSFLPSPPCARGHGCLGSLPELAERGYRLLPFLRSYEKTYGEKGICKLQLGPKVFHIVSDPTIASEILKHSTSFGRGESLRVWRKFSPGGLDEGTATLKWRKQAMRAIGSSQTLHFFPSVRHIAEQWGERLEKIAEAGKPVDIMMEAERAALAAIGETLFKINPHDPKEPNPFGLKPENDKKCFRFLKAFHDLFELITGRITSSLANIPYAGDALYNWAYKKESEKMENAKETLKKVLRPIFENLLRKPERIPAGSHFEKLMQNFGIDIHKPDYDLILDNSLGFLQASFETASKSLGWTLYMLASNPEIQSKLARELQEAFGEEPPHEASELKRCPYLFKVIEESLRLFPPFPFLLRDIKNPEAFKHYQVNQGDTFILSPFFIHRNPAYWEDPENFKPERFTEEMLSDKWQVAHPEYLTFLSGIHRCPGRFFAKQELGLLLSEFILKFQVAADQSAPPPEFKLCVTLQTEAPMMLTIERRKDL